MTGRIAPAPAGDPIVTAHQMSKRYGTTTAVRDVSLTVERGQVVCLLGPNGAGKSTTMRMLATLTRPDSGSARVAGFDVATESRRVRARIGYIAQQAGTDGYLTGRENLRIQAYAQRLSRGTVARRVPALLERIGLSTAADRPVNTYSGGMRRRLEIAMGIVHDPQVIFLDEPTTGLDPEGRADLWRQLSALSDQHTLSILLTTHYLEEADHLADQIMIIDHGRVITEGTPTDLKARVGTATVIIECAIAPIAAIVESAVGWVDPHCISIEGSTVRVSVADGPRAVPPLITALSSHGLEITSATIATASLDDVYRQHTGHRITTDDNSADALARTR